MHKTPKRRDILVQSARKQPIMYFNEKKLVGQQILHNEREAILRIMKQIGSFD